MDTHTRPPGPSAKATELSIYRQAALCGVLVALAQVVPRFVPNTEGGFASAASAVLVFLVMLIGALVVALHLLWRTWRAYDTLGRTARIAGIAPAIVLTVTLVGLLLFLGY